MMYLAAVGGFALLFGGGEFLVRGAVAVSRRFGLSPLLIGMTVVAWCTSAPELVVSLGAALRGSSDIAVGNVVGSNIFNVLGVLGASAVIAPIIVKPEALRRDTGVMLAAALALALIALTGEIGRVAGAVLLVALAAFVTYSYRTELSGTQPSRELHEHEAEEFTGPGSIGAGIGYLALGLGALVIGSQLLITGATDIARTYGVSEAIIGLSLVAVGTSLPELATSVMAAARGHADVAVGNVVGSNIFNILGILGIAALVRPIGVAAHMASLDVWVMLGVCVTLALLLLVRGRIGRIEGGVFLALYAGYMVLLFS
ncbi:MAG: calcium/sodium antiporter [Coriobacteriia bacterium]|nr:calcium/sodium antiporter [Coriobacteriia bacterium]